MAKNHKKHSVVFSQILICKNCQKQQTFFGEDSTGSNRQAKINAHVEAAKTGWYIDYDARENLCSKCNDNKSS
jgi:neutral trehalase